MKLANNKNSGEITIPVHPYTGRNSGFGFVDLMTAEDAEKALTDLNGKTLGERTIFCQLAKSPSEKKPAPKRAARVSARRARGGKTGTQVREFSPKL